MPSGNGNATAQMAVDRALKKVGTSVPPRTCLFQIRSLYNGNGGPPTAIAGWYAAQYKHPGDLNPPIGAAVWWGGGAGHVAIVVGAGGQIVSTDWPHSGVWGKTTLSEMNSHWHKPYKGWTEDIGGKHVITGAGGVIGSDALNLGGVLDGAEEFGLGVADPTGLFRALYTLFKWMNDPKHWQDALYVALGILVILFVVLRIAKDDILEAL